MRPDRLCTNGAKPAENRRIRRGARDAITPVNAQAGRGDEEVTLKVYSQTRYVTSAIGQSPVRWKAYVYGRRYDKTGD